MVSQRPARARRWPSAQRPRFSKRRLLGLLAFFLGLPTVAAGASIHDSVRQDDLPALRAQLAGGAAVDAADADGLTPLVLAAVAGRRAAVALLLAAGADANRIAHVQGRGLAKLGLDVPVDSVVDGSPLLAAVMRGDAEIVAALLRAGADASRRLGDAAPLHLAAERGDVAIVHALLAGGAHVDAVTADGPTPLLIAVDNGHDAVVEALLAAGADVSRADGEGRTPLSEAMRRADADMMVALRRHLAQPQGALGSAAVDVEGDRPGAPAPTPLPLAIAVTAANGGRVCWSDANTARIDCVAPAGGAVRRYELPLSGVQGLAFDAAGTTIYWTADRTFPRAIGSLDLRSGAPTVLLAGPWVNRPRAIAFEPATASLWWSERVSGRLRQRAADGAWSDVVRTDLASPTDPEGAALSILGIAFVGADRIVWSDVAGQRLEQAKLDGSERTVVVGVAEGVRFPVGVATAADGELWWADAATAEIWRRPPGGKAVVVLGPAAGLVEPRGLAIDSAAQRLYWADAGRAVLGRAAFDGSSVEELSLVAAAVGFRAPAAPAALPQRCSAALVQLADEHRRQTAKALRLCLEAVDLHQAVKAAADEVRAAAPLCGYVFAVVHQDAGRIGAALAQHCATPSVRRAAAAGLCQAEPAEAQQWSSCLTAGWRTEVYRMQAARLPRSAWWLAEVEPFVAAQPASAVLAEARAVLATAAVSPRRGFPASGQTTAYRAHRRGGETVVAVADDGATTVGAPLVWRDLADGTLLDEATGLLWEKKCDACGGIHDVAYQARWSSRHGDETVWDWLARLNRDHGGFAGHQDWRLPNVKELQSLIDYERFNPAVGSSFDGAACGLGCRDLTRPECSCTETSDYWTSTTSPADPGRALAVGFHLGLVGDVDKADDLPVRAVRGPVPRRTMEASHAK